MNKYNFTNQTSTITIVQTTVWFFGKKKKKWNENNSHQKSKNPDFKTGELKEKNPPQRAVMIKKLKPHMVTGQFRNQSCQRGNPGVSRLPVWLRPPTSSHPPPLWTGGSEAQSRSPSFVFVSERLLAKWGHQAEKQTSKQIKNWSPHFHYYSFDLIRTLALPGQTTLNTRGGCHTCRALFRNNLSLRSSCSWINRSNCWTHRGSFVPVAGQIRVQLRGLKHRQRIKKRLVVFRNDISSVKAPLASECLAVTRCGCVASGGRRHGGFS